MFFHSNIKLLRQHRGLSAEVVAVNLGISRSRLSGYENQTYQPGYELLIAISNFYRVRIDDLLRTDLTKLPVYKLEEMQRAFNS